MMSLGFIANLKLMRKGLIKNCRLMANPSGLIEDTCAIATEVCKGDVGWCCFSAECGDFDDVGDAVLMACKLFDS